MLGPRGIFGDRTDRLRELIVESVKDTHDRHAAAQDLINRRSQLAYGGSIWAELPNNLNHIVRQEFLDATAKRYPRSQYALPILNDCIIFVWRPAGGQSPDEADFFTSGLRANLFDADELSEPTLFEVRCSEASPDRTEIEELFSNAEADQRKVVLVAVTSRSERLDVIEWGQVKRVHGRDDQLEWSGRERLFSFDDENYRPTSAPKRTFADGQPPAAIVTSRNVSSDE